MDPDCRVIYIGERAGKFSNLLEGNQSIDEVHTIYAGKFRRYHGESWIRRLLDIKTNILNIRDLFYFMIGRFQAGRLIKKLMPDVVFLKGGFVGVPVGLAAGRRGIAIITHDSDALPGLANRLVSRFVSTHATALPSSYYHYPEERVVQTGVLVEHAFQPVSPLMQQQYKEQLGLEHNSQVLLITGSSSGSARINQAAKQIMEQLLTNNPRLTVIHQVGKGKGGVYGHYRHERLKVLEFLKPIYMYMGSADLVVCRASGNTLAELGVQGKACIAIPSPHLAGGHQLKNADRLLDNQAAVVLQESELDADPDKLLRTIEDLLHHEDRRAALAQHLQKLVIPDAAKRLAVLLLDKARYVSQKEK